jgi:PAS domain S-box-containing protein
VTELSRYELKLLRSDSEFTLRRGRRFDGNDPILVLSSTSEQQAPPHLRRFEHELSLAEELEPAWSVRPRALVRHDGRAVLVMEDPGGAPLEDLIGRSIELERFLRIAISLTAGIGQAHGLGLIHKDIKPANILVNQTGDVWLTGFGIASRLVRERQTAAPAEVIAGTIAYMAPEQTGRMNRSIDTRSDLYAVGIVLYELLTGTHPFSASEPMEWIHCHIARKPQPPSERVGGIPGAVEAIILKLLAKDSEDRYQTATGVEADLRKCLTALKVYHRIDPFLLGAHDILDRLLIPEKLYGREAEIRTLVAAFDAVATHGETGRVLVSGHAGIGKSSVVNELHKVLLPRHGLFAAGKFDQYNRDIPYATLAQALQDLVRQLLSKSDAELGRWSEELLEALSPNGQLMVSLVPELALIIGDQSPVTDLAPQDAQNRFLLVFRRMLSVFARPEHPLVIFLDDMQWLDVATIELLERLVGEPDVGYFLLICAYRDEEVGPTHPLNRMLATVAAAKGQIKELRLGPLKPNHVGTLVADALHTDPHRVAALAGLMFEKTGGNPFFTIQFLTALVGEGLIAFDAAEACWQLDLDGIRAKAITDNVADLLTGRLKRLSGKTLDVIKQLACIGSHATIGTISAVLGCSETETRSSLSGAVAAGLLSQSAGAYAFTHDRVHEAAYALVPQDEHAEMHLRIGQLLASRTPPEELDERIFEIVNQINRGAILIQSSQEREQAAELNLIAGKRAKGAAAYASALTYLATGRALLQADSWTRNFRLTFDLELSRAECELLTGDPCAAEARLLVLWSKAPEVTDRADVLWLAVALYMTVGPLDRAVEICLEYLGRVGIVWSHHPTDEEVNLECRRMWRQIGSRPIEALIDLPVMTDRSCRATIDVLASLLPVAYVFDNNLFALVVLQMANLSLENGNCDGSSYAYCELIMVLGPRFNELRSGYQFGMLGLDLVEKRGLDRFKARVYSAFAILILPWIKPLRASLEMSRNAVGAALEVGDLPYAAWSYSIVVANLLVCGDHLADLQQEVEQALKLARKTQWVFVIEIVKTQLKFVHTLRGLTPKFAFFTDADFDEHTFEQLVEGQSTMAVANCWYRLRKLQAYFIAEEFALAMQTAAEMRGLLWTSMVTFETAEYHFYAALTLAAHSYASPPSERLKLLSELAAHHAKIVLWAKDCPENFSTRAALVGAEIARLENRELDAESLFEQSIRSARENGLVQNEAIANECAARFHAARGFSTISDAYLRNARACYLRWGADGKVRQMERAYPQLRREPHLKSGTTVSTAAEHLDLATVVKVMQSVSSEIDLKKLIEVLMVTALEHAGGDRGLLVFAGDETWIEAEAVAVDGRIKVSLQHTKTSAVDLPESILRYVTRTRDSLLLDDAAIVNQFSADEYIQKNRSRSILCMPLTKQEKVIGALYLENSQTAYAFTAARFAVLKLLTSQAANSLENARLYSELQHAEASLADAQRLTHTGHYKADVSSGRISWSEEVYRIFEFDPGTEVTFERVLQHSHPEDHDRMRQFINRSMEDGEEYSFRHRLVMSNGAIKTLSIIGHAVKDEGGKVSLTGTAMDITESTRAQERLQASLTETQLAQARLQEAQRLVQLGTWVWDLSTNRIICSEEHRQIFGFTPEQLNSTYEFSLNTLHPDDRPRVRTIVEQAIREGKTFSCEFRTVLPDGSIRHVHGRGGPSTAGPNEAKEYIGTILDITERKRQEEERQKLVSLIENSSDFIGYSSTIGAIEYLNAGGRRMVGLEPDEDLSNVEMSDLRGPDDDLRFQSEVLPALLRNGHWEGERVWRNLKTADLIPILQTIFYVNDAVTKHPLGVATISRDISERKKVEDALRKSQAELARVARLTTMGELTGSIAHEVNQPLMAIVTNGAACLGWLSGEKINVEKARPAAEQIVSDGHRAGDVVRSIRELIRKTTPKMVQVDVNELIEATLDLMRAELGQNGILLEANLEAGLGQVNGDRVQLQQVILNLVKNGIEAMEGQKGRRVLRVVTKASGHKLLQIAISDTGVGLDSGHAERIFDAFYTTKPDGIGLGLAICRSIIESHGGHLWTSPNTPTGSVFCFTLPIAANRILPNGTA